MSSTQYLFQVTPGFQEKHPYYVEFLGSSEFGGRLPGVLIPGGFPWRFGKLFIRLPILILIQTSGRVQLLTGRLLKFLT